ncbi:MAG TPA: glycerophosphodiester phosphodiesterase [Cyclobacteriaceae bacterium]|nr:glycerophosphodiester phosphodiesterase [Cyclobacteriaceae bacterium]
MMRTEYPTIRMRLQHLSCGFHLWGVALLYSCMLKLATVLFLLAFVTAGHAQYIPRFDVQGHRGARGLKPENSIPAFLTALDYGVTTLELDLAVTSDRRLVVSHEPWMSAAICLTPDGKPISRSREKAYNIYEMTYEEVAAFDCGSRGNKAFPDQQPMPVSKPLLRDVIAAVEDHIRSVSRYEVDYNIEIKSSPDGDGKFHPPPAEFSDLVYELLDQYLPMRRVVIQSFDFRVLQYWRKKYPDVRLAALVENAGSVSGNLKRLGFNPSIYSPYYKLVTRDMVRYLHRRGIRVIPWTVNDESDMLSLKALGVDGFITDYPDRPGKYKMTLGITPK